MTFCLKADGCPPHHWWYSNQLADPHELAASYLTLRYLCLGAFKALQLLIHIRESAFQGGATVLCCARCCLGTVEVGLVAGQRGLLRASSAAPQIYARSAPALTYIEFIIRRHRR
jgi:hypothetical protein